MYIFIHDVRAVYHDSTRTGNGKRKLISRGVGGELDIESTGRDKRLVDTAEHVDWQVVVQLSLAPHQRRVEQTIVIRVEAAFHRHRAPDVHHVELTVGDHRQKIA